MPTYEFRCPDGHVFDRFYRKMSDAVSEVACPECGKIATRQMSAGAGLLFKGSGFYLTDYGKNAHRGERHGRGDGLVEVVGGRLIVVRREGRQQAERDEGVRVEAERIEVGGFERFVDVELEQLGLVRFIGLVGFIRLVGFIELVRVIRLIELRHEVR